MAKRKIQSPTEAAPVASYKHDAKRMRIPTQEESVKLSARDKQPVKTRYAYDPSIDPQLVWAGKEEQGTEFAVPTVPIYVQEKVAPEAIIARLKSGVNEIAQMMLFGETTETQFSKAVDFYKHEDNWQNRMILGDSLLVMNSLLEKEGMRGRVQTIYIDPPYGIKFGSNWQVSTRKRDVKDNKLEDFIRQPEQVKAFRDTWELGIHSYLSYMRDRLITARELLTESGSCFVQIADENVHLVRSVMDEVFGSENFISIITFQKTTGAGSPSIGTQALATVNDFIIWYGKEKDKTKYRQLYSMKEIGGRGGDAYSFIEEPGGLRRRATTEEISNHHKLLEKGYRFFRLSDIRSQSGNEKFAFDIELGGEKYSSRNLYWKTNEKGIGNLILKNRLLASGNSVNYVRYADDFPAFPINNIWTDLSSGVGEKYYVVQTNAKVIQRCLLMTTDPSDMVLDPTCGSGTTAYVAEQWGRRWITIDTSRVSLAIARTRLMTAKAWFK